MKSIAAVILAIVLLSVVITQLSETSNVLKEKVTLDAAVLTSCRVASGLSLENSELRDLELLINEAEFMQFFSEAFCSTLDVELINAAVDSMIFASPSGRFNDITLRFEFYTVDYSGREVMIVRVDLSTPYVFRTALLREASGFATGVSHITGSQMFEIALVN
ncbi:MAG: hypothetical protein FWD34_01270 [Oscillospiraceae bacterium]|nr:hypothetical protein [Oscillospiraceae bacterium]